MKRIVIPSWVKLIVLDRARGVCECHKWCSRLGDYPVPDTVRRLALFLALTLPAYLVCIAILVQGNKPGRIRNEPVYPATVSADMALTKYVNVFDFNEQIETPSGCFPGHKVLYFGGCKYSFGFGPMPGFLRREDDNSAGRMIEFSIRRLEPWRQYGGLVLNGGYNLDHPGGRQSDILNSEPITKFGRSDRGWRIGFFRDVDIGAKLFASSSGQNNYRSDEGNKLEESNHSRSYCDYITKIPFIVRLVLSFIGVVCGFVCGVYGGLAVGEKRFLYGLPFVGISLLLGFLSIAQWALPLPFCRG